MNFLEQLAAEWYTRQGYFVRTNLKFGKRPRGGWAGEMDVAAFHPSKQELVHLETSMDADRWDERRKKFERKFRDAEAHRNDLFSFEVRSVRRVAVVGWSAAARPGSLGPDVEVKSIAQFTRDIAEELKRSHPAKDAVPESLPLLRAMQFALHWGGGTPR